MKVRKLSSILPMMGAICLLRLPEVLAQTSSVELSHPAAATAPTAVPALISYSGVAIGEHGKALSGETSITFLIYNDAQGGEPLFTETQALVPDLTGHYTVHLGATSPNGLPTDLFATGEARWLEVQIAGQPAQPRVLLASVPYALKAADATTLGGLPASAFALAGSKTGVRDPAPGEISPDAAMTVTTTGGTANKLAKFSGANTIVNSILYDNGTDVGIGTTSPTATLDVAGTTSLNGDVAFNGSSTYKGELTFEPTNTASASAGHDSWALKFYASAYDSANMTAVNPRFYWQAEPQGNNTVAPTGTLNLLASRGTNSAAETGFYFNPNGTMNFAPGQTFPVTSAAFPANSTDSAYFGGAGNSTSTGSDDTASGFHALASNTTGSLDTAVGYSAGPDSGSTGLTNATAIGANATVSQSNSLVLGKTTAGSPGASHVNVGIGTAKPASALEVSVKASSALGPSLTLTNPGGAGGSPTNAGTATSIDFNSYLPAAEPEGTLPEARIEAVDDGLYSDNLIFSSKFVSGQFSFLQQNLTIQSNGQVAVGLPTSGTLPGLSALLTVFDTGPTGWDGIDTFGGAEVGAGISATGGDETASSDIQGGTGGYFVGGYSPGTTGDGIYAAPGDAEFSSGAGWAGFFNGNIDVTGTVFGGAKDFKIDHPLDPANKYLVHASVESSEMMNIYTGNVVTDELGLATVKLPDWFEAENTDFRYQLTVIGRRAQAWVAEEVSRGQFRIASDATNTKVSWQITAVRQDPYAKAHPLVVEEIKPVHERGFYEHPELYGQPANKQSEWGRNPQQMQRMKEMREQQKLKSSQHVASQRAAAQVAQSKAPAGQIKPISQVENNK